MGRRQSLGTVLAGIRAGIYGPEMPFEDDLLEAIAPGVDDAALIAAELPALSPATRAAVVLVLARRGRREAAPFAEPLLEDADPYARFQAALALALLGDGRGGDEIRRQIAGGAPAANRYHVVDFLEEALGWTSSPEIAALLADARAALG